MHWSHFTIRSVLVLTAIVAGGTAVAQAGGPGPAFAYALFVSAVSAHILAVRVGHAVSGHTVVRTSCPLGPQRPETRSDATPLGGAEYHASPLGVRRVRWAGIAGVAAGSALALILLVPWLGWALHPMALVATGCSGASLGGLLAMSIVGICDFFGNLK